MSAAQHITACMSMLTPVGKAHARMVPIRAAAVELGVSLEFDRGKERFLIYDRITSSTQMVVYPVVRKSNLFCV